MNNRAESRAESRAVNGHLGQPERQAGQPDHVHDRKRKGNQRMKQAHHVVKEMPGERHVERHVERRVEHLVEYPVERRVEHLVEYPVKHLVEERRKVYQQD